METENTNDLPKKRKRGNPNIGKLGEKTRFDKKPEYINKNGRPPAPAQTVKSFFERFGIDIQTYSKEEMAEEANVILALSDEQLLFLLENKKQLSQFAKGIVKCINSVQKTGRVIDLQNAIKIAYPKYFENENQLPATNTQKIEISILNPNKEADNANPI